MSYAVGAVGSFVYLRMLNRSVEGMTGGGLGGALGQPRLLIPIVLALGYNRYPRFERHGREICPVWLDLGCTITHQSLQKDVSNAGGSIQNADVERLSLYHQCCANSGVHLISTLF